MPTQIQVPLFDPATPIRAIRDRIDEAVAGVLDSEAYILGPNVRAFEQEWAEWNGIERAIGLANGTEAITIALRALGVGPGDEVVVPSFTFYASAEAIPPTGARPVFCDVDPQTFLVTAETVKAALTPKTKAVIAVHLFGNVAPVKEIEALGVPVVEDTAQAAGSLSADGVKAGTLGTIGTFSFYPSKNLGAFGDGGAIVTHDPTLAEQVEVLRFHGSRDKVTYETWGYNSRLDEMQAAILRAQLPELEAWCDARRRAAELYAEAGLGDYVGLPVPANGSDPSWGLYVVRHEAADALEQHLAEAGIGAKGYYRTPIHEQEGMTAFVDQAPDLPGTAQAAREHLALPMSAALDESQVEQVVDAVRSFSD